MLSYLGYGCAPILILSFTGIFINLKYYSSLIKVELRADTGASVFVLVDSERVKDV